MKATRVGHGYNAWDDSSVIDLIREKGIHLEVKSTLAHTVHVQYLGNVHIEYSETNTCFKPLSRTFLTDTLHYQFQHLSLNGHSFNMFLCGCMRI